MMSFLERELNKSKHPRPNYESGVSFFQEYPYVLASTEENSVFSIFF